MSVSPTPLEVFQALPVPVLTSLATGGTDGADLARRTLRDQGLDDNGMWVGFGKSDSPVNVHTAVIAALGLLNHELTFLGDAFAGYEGTPEQVAQLLSELFALVPGCQPLTVEGLVSDWFDTQTPPE